MSFDDGHVGQNLQYVRRRLRNGVREIDGLERALWILVALALVGDVVTTFAGLHLGLNESNPVARSAIEGWGVVGMLALKAVAVAVGLACRSLIEDPYRPIVPAALAIPWAFAVVVNVYMISAVV